MAERICRQFGGALTWVRLAQVGEHLEQSLKMYANVDGADNDK